MKVWFYNMENTLEEYKNLFMQKLNVEEKREVIIRAINMEISFLLDDEEDMSDYISGWNREIQNVKECDTEDLNNYIDDYYLENNLEDIMPEFVEYDMEVV